MRQGIAVACILSVLLVLSFATFSSAASVNYYYDESGRLIAAVSDTGDTVIYNYDEVGNLISITKSTSEQSPPVLNGMNPHVLLAGTSVSVTLTGENLFTTKSVASDNAGMTISNVSATASEIMATLQIAPGAPVGPSTIDVTTAYGIASLNVTVYRVSADPATKYISADGIANLSVSLTPAPTEDVTIQVDNRSPDTVSAPQSIVVPVGNDASTLTITAVNNGTGFLDVGGQNVTIFVTPPLTGDVALNSAPVSVNIQSPPSGITCSQPVSIGILTEQLNGIYLSEPVSVQWH